MSYLTIKTRGYFVLWSLEDLNVRIWALEIVIFKDKLYFCAVTVSFLWCWNSKRWSNLMGTIFRGAQFYWGAIFLTPSKDSQKYPKNPKKFPKILKNCKKIPKIPKSKSQVRLKMADYDIFADFSISYAKIFSKFQH